MQLAQMLISLLRIKLIAISLVLLTQLSYASTIGNVVLQEGIASVERKGTESDLGLDSDIMFMDNVKTGKGELGITFIDDTNVAVSSQSSLIIDDFVYDPNSAEGSKLVLRIALGTVRYASGNIAKLNKQNVDNWLLKLNSGSMAASKPSRYAYPAVEKHTPQFKKDITKVFFRKFWFCS